VRLAHLSDLHLLSLEGVRVVDFLNKRVTGGLNLLFNRGGQFPADVARSLAQDIRAQQVDHVVVSGDLTNLAFPAELELVRGILEEIGLPPSEITVVPGNHDYYTRRSAVDDHFARVMAPFLAGDLQPGPGPFPHLRLRGELALLALSSARPSPWLMAVGTLGPQQIQLARQLLDHEACRGCFRLVVLHHAPHKAFVKWHNRLTDAAAFADLLRATGAELVVHGHLHRPLRESLPGPDGSVPVVGVGSATWLSPKDPARRAQYNLYEIADRSLARLRTRRYEPASQTFCELE
jgi:3',5'-cyclic AMP phosphodiesterase CpdA